MDTRRTLAMLSAAALAVGLASATTPVAQAVNTVGVTVTIHHVWEVDCDDNELEFGVIVDSCPNDYYAKAFFPNGERISPRAADDQTEITPGWQLAGTFDRDAGPFGIRIQLWDHDSTSGDDQIDIASGDDSLDITVDPNSGDFSGDVPTPSLGYATGSGSDSAAIYFSVTFGNSVDFDGDGLHDGIERSGIVTDKNGTVPQHGNLRALDANDANGTRPTAAANPCRPTLLTEVDYMVGPDANGDSVPDHTHKPTQVAIDEAVAAFNSGDVPTRPGCPYPNVNQNAGVELMLIIDDLLPETDKVGWATGPTVGGAMVTGQSIRNANFDAGLRKYFHYSLWIHRQQDVAPPPPAAPTPLVPNGSSGICCSDSGKDVIVSLGGWAGDVGTDRDQSSTFVHELGHALGLGHGGGDTINCKPNYHSIMSYVYQTMGVPDNASPGAPFSDVNQDGTIDNRDKVRLDLSREQLNNLDEDALSESAGISGRTADVFLWDSDGARPWRVSVSNAAVNWNGSGDGTDIAANIDPGTVAVDANFMGIRTSQGCPNTAAAGSPPGPGTPPPGSVGTPELNGYDDWANLKYRGPLSPPGSGVGSEHELTKEMADEIRAAFNEAVSRTDVDVHLTDSPDPVGAGTQLTYGLEAHNHGSPNTAYEVKVAQTLPSDVTFASASAGCAHAAGVVTCDLGDLAPGASASANVVVNVPADLVHNNGGPKDITSSATASHDGTDSNTANNTASTTTKVVAMADVQVTGATATGPREVLIGESGSVTFDVAIANAGPSSPIDTVLTTSASGDSGVTVTPASSTSEQAALAVGSPRTVRTTAAVDCASPGVKTVTLTAALALKNAADTDPDLTNNQRASSFQIDCVVPIAINVRPKGFPNSINLNTDATVAALTTAVGEYGLPIAFDATKIDVSTTLWGLRANLFDAATPFGAREVHSAGHPERSYELDERTRDADLDLVLHFKPADSGLTLSSTEACLKGRYLAPDGNTYTFLGCDSVRVVN
ncbi:Peptidase M66 [Actinokineospora alba]|uniref:Peptidase M66 n=1 Tax=Actinokineospora alba TaxID=504798 RepID=A0A1H0JWU2_9PSEU|nr:M66 family metalloprotease [Actinokineospora alba]TDP68140.1 peptidase M66-like protein [Actinokineospora alba]SDH93044.1 Peptidase M66 [Actinokineospora alba]SDO47861.1 Peptidase M66 [Actinokineospora alba]